MALRTAVRTNDEGGTYRYTWSAVEETDTCDPVKHPGAADKTIVMVGTPDGSTWQIQGSVYADGAADAYFPLTDPFGNVISLTVTKTGEGISENTTWIKPVNTVAGAGSCVVVFTLLVRNTMPR